MPFEHAVYCMNKVSQEFMVRPMGIFQLIDYVGIDVCSYIMSVMNPYLENENLHSPLLDKMLSLDVRGGQNSDGSQKNGFLRYEKGRPKAIYSPDKGKYVEISSFQSDVDATLGKMPEVLPQWKNVVRDKNKDAVLVPFFNSLKTSESAGAQLAIEYMKKSKEIGLKLVADNVAQREDDVNTVMLTGFFHAYPPINNYI